MVIPEKGEPVGILDARLHPIRVGDRVLYDIEKRIHNRKEAIVIGPASKENKWKQEDLILRTAAGRRIERWCRNIYVVPVS